LKKLTTLGAATLALALPTIGSAQTTDITPYNFGFRGGFVFPIDEGLRAVDRTFFGIGVDYTLPQFTIFPGAETFLSFDWFVRSRAGGQNVFPILLNQRFYLSPADAIANRRTYAFAGLGAVIFDGSPSSTRIGGRVGLGVELGPNLYGEASLFLSDVTRVTGVRATGLGVYLGYRF
jgi:hypothetical protein